MASNLQNAAAKAVIKQHPCSFYDAIPSIKTNPVLASFRKEKQNFISFVSDKKKSKTYLEPELHGRLSMMLFEVWNKYQTLLPEDYYWKQLLEIGNFLVEQREFSLALSLCFDRLLFELNIKKYDLKSTELNDYQNWHFPNGLQTDTANLVIQALIGKYICTFNSVKMWNPMLTCAKAMDDCLQILSLIRILTQILLPHENWCWLLYNCTIHIYTMCREMMLLGHSAKVLEFLVWACMCLENSLPLLNVQFLTWRTTLYTAVCLCYWDSMSGQQAEAFARRALCKISDLWQIEKLKTEGQVLTKDMNALFRESTLKMALMIFRRAVFETRRKQQKPPIRLKTRFNIKDFINVGWPRTPTEKLLVEMFDCGSSQFMAILESLNNSRQRIVPTNGCSQWEVELIDSATELFHAAKEILTGNAEINPSGKKSKKHQPVFGFFYLIDIEESTLMELATAGDNRIPVSAVFQLARLAFCYEQWEIFEFLAEPLKVLSNQQYSWDVKSLEILSVIERLMNGRKRRKSLVSAPTSGDEEESKTNLVAVASATSLNGGSKTNGDDLIRLAQVLQSVLMEKFTRQQVDLDIVVDAVLLLWNKSKSIIHRHQTGSEDKSKYFQKPENQNKWLHILDVTLHIMCWCGMATIDPSILMEVAMRLALLLETCAATPSQKKATARMSLRDPSCLSLASDEDLSSNSSCSLATDYMGKSGNELLKMAKTVLEVTLEQVAKGRNTDERHLADVSWIKQENPEPCGESRMEEEANENTSKGDNPFEHLKLFESTIRSQHTELLLIYYRVSFRLKNLEVKQSKLSTSKSFRKTESLSLSDFARILETLQVECGANNLQKSLLYMQASNSINPCSQQERKQMLEQSLNFLEKFQKEEVKVFETNTNTVKNSNLEKRKVPPAPILIHRSGSKMVFRPAPFVSADGDSVAWYRLFAQSVKSSNPKVRMNDMSVDGTGELLISDCDTLTVSGLDLNQRYMFALAAYTASGQLIGGGIGESTKPILVMNPMSILMTYAFLCQMAFKLGFSSISQHAFNFLWSHFVTTDKQKPSLDYVIDSPFDQFRISRPKLNKHILTSTAVSPLLLRLMYRCVMTQVDIGIQQGGLVCNKICDQGSFLDGQKKRLKECEKLFVAIEISGWLNDYQLCLQAIVQCYGLLSPLLYHRVAYIPVAQILLQCLAALQELPVSVRQKRPASTAESLHHMTAVMTNQAAKILFEYNEKSLALRVYDVGLKILQRNLVTKKSTGSDTNLLSSTNLGGATEEKLAPDLKIQEQPTPLNSKSTPKRIPGLNKQDDLLNTNEELANLETAMNRTSKLISNESDLQIALAQDNVRMVLANIYMLPSTIVYKEVNKYRKRPSFPELFLRVIEKAIWEGNNTLAQTLCEDLHTFLRKKNEASFNIKYKIGEKKKGKPLEKDISEETQKFSATVVEYGKDKDKDKDKDKEKDKVSSTPGKTEKKPPKRKKKKRIFQHDSPEIEEAKMNALDVFITQHLAEKYRQSKLRASCRRALADEFPIQSQLVMFLGIVQFNLLLERIEQANKVQPNVHLPNYGTYHDDDWYSFETTGMLLCIENKMAEETREIRPQSQPSVNKKGRPSSSRKAPTPQLSQSEMSWETNKESIRKSLTNLKMSMVLAHRGKMWSLLQNSAKILWDMIQTIQFQLVTVHNKPHKETFCLTFQEFNKLVCPRLVPAADFLLDMLKEIREPEKNRTNTPDKKKSEEPHGYNESLFGTIQNVKGGSLLSFEPFLDDTTIVDIRLVQKICMKAMAMLHQQEKWERLADIILRFNALTNERFAEYTLPLLIDAQNNMIDYLKTIDKDHVLPQPHFKKLTDEVGAGISAKDYLNAEFNLTVDKKQVITGPPEKMFDPYGHPIHKAEKDNDMFRRLISVPLDVEYSWKCLETLIGATNYGARALNHSRRLLGIFVIGQQQLKYEHKAEDEKTVKPLSLSVKKLLEPLPQPGFDFLHEDADNTLSSYGARDQLENVITSYSQTAELLLDKNENQMAAQALTELANVHSIAGNRRLAYVSWNKSLTLILGLNDKPVLDWKKVYRDEDPGQQLLQSCGIWGCLHGGIVATNIARYAVSNDWLSSLQYCILAYNLFKALFRCSIQHPLCDRQYAVYEMGEGCPVPYLIPGVQVIMDRHRCNPRQLISSLEFVISKLYLYEHYLKILPLLALHLYFARSLCRDVKLCVQGQIQRVLTLTNLHLFSEAIKTLQQLLNGERLPQLGSPHFRPVEIKMESLDFDSSLTFNDATNIKVFEVITERYLLVNLNSLYGTHLSDELLLAHAHLLVTLADCLNVIPEDMDSHDVPEPIAAKKNKFRSESDPQPSSVILQVPLNDEKFTTLERMKHTLLSSATSRLDILMEKLQLKTGSINNKLEERELELAIRCLLEQSNISLQKHLSYFAATFCSQALNLLQHSTIFLTHREPPKPKRKGTTLSFQSIQSIRKRSTESRSKLNDGPERHQTNPDILGCQHWLKCRLRLVQAMLTDVSSLVTCSELGDPVLSELPSFDQLCQDGQEESKSWRNPEMEAAFIYVEVVKKFEVTHCGKTCHPLLQKGINLLKSCPELSYSGLNNLLAFRLLETDLKIGSPGPLTAPMVKETLNSYIEIRDLAEKLLRDLGESIQHTATNTIVHISCPVFPMKNIYLRPLNIVVHAKLRISLMLAKLYLKPLNLCTTPEVEQRNLYLLDCLAVLQNARNLNRKSFSWDAGLEVEILLQIGKLERELVKKGMLSPFTPMYTFMDAIKVSYFARYSLILMKNAYLEIALIAANQLKRADCFVCARTKAQSNISGRQMHFSVLGFNNQNQFAMIAWLSVRSAAVITSCRGSMMTLTQQGKLGVHNELLPEAKTKIPDFLNLDLFGKYVFGKKKKVYKSEFDKDYDLMMEAAASASDHKEPTKEDRLQEIKEFSSNNVTWSYLLNYSFHLFEQHHRAMVSANRNLQEEEVEAEADVEVNSKQSQTTFHQAFLCSPNLGPTQQIRYGSTYSFITNNLMIFNKQCAVDYLPPKLEDMIEYGKLPPDLTVDSPPSPNERFLAFQEERTLPSEFQKPDSKFYGEQKLPYPTFNEVCFQWYNPPFNTIVIAMEQHQTPIYLLCTATRKKEKPGELDCLFDYFLFPHDYITDIYKRIKKVIHLKEVQQKASSPILKTPPGGAKRKSKGNIAVSPSEMSSDAESELNKEIFQILEDIQILLRPKAKKLVRAPFELNNPNLNQLLEMFDVSSGSILITSDIASWILKIIFL